MTSLPILVDLVIESTSGGAGRHVIDLYEELERRGHDVRVIASMERSDEAFRSLVRSLDSSRVVLLPLRRAPHPGDLTALTAFRDNLRQASRPRILHAHSTKAGALVAALARTGMPRIFTPHAYRGMDPQIPRIKRRLIRMAENWISRRFDRILAVSPEESAYAIGLGVPQAKVAFVPNGVDAEALAERAVSNLAPGGDEPLLGFVGRLCHQKNPLSFVRLVHETRQHRSDVRGVLIGDGEMRGVVEQEIANLGLEGVVSVAGYVDFVPRARQIDVLVHTSHYESLPYALLEACAIGVPVVAVRNAGTRAIFGTDASGFPGPDEVLALRDRVLTLLASEGERRNATARGKEVAQAFSKNAMVDRIEFHYRTVATQSGMADLSEDHRREH